MTLVILIGPQAVGKMTVGKALEERTDLSLFHNHVSIDMVTPFFSYGSAEGRALVAELRDRMFRAVAASDHPGMIFTYVWAFDHPADRDYIEGLAGIFSSAGRRVCWVELEADLDIRLGRNASPHRLSHKPSKRDVEASNADLLRAADTYRLNSDPGEMDQRSYLRINNSHLPPEEAADRIKAEFDLS